MLLILLPTVFRLSCFSRFVGTSAAVIPVRFGRVGLAVIPVLLAGLNYFFSCVDSDTESEDCEAPLASEAIALESSLGTIWILNRYGSLIIRRRLYCVRLASQCDCRVSNSP